MLNAAIIPHAQVKEYDSINFRIVPFKFQGTREYTLVEEKIKDGRVVSDLRRQLDKNTFASLAHAVIATLEQDLEEANG